MTFNRNSTEEGKHLVAEFRIEPDERANCSILAAGQRGENVRQDMVAEEGQYGSGCDCRAEAVVDGESRRRYIEGTVADHCICPVFAEHDCIASIVGFEGRELIVSLSVPDREALKDIVEDLREIEARPRLQQLTKGESKKGGGVHIDPEAVTDKQREALSVAVEAGYYQTPRQASLQELSEELGISKSAVSQRLTAVEAQLVGQLMQTDTNGGVAATHR